MEFGKTIKTFKSKKGNEVIFRYPKANDFDAIWKFACEIAEEDTFVTLNIVPTEEEERLWFDDMMKSVEKQESIYIMVEVNGVYAGNCRVLRGKYRSTHVGDVGISLLSKFRDEGIGIALMKSLIDEAKALGLRLLTLRCYENNPRALHIYEKLGFQKAGVTPGAILYKGEYIGEIKMFLPLA